MEKFRTGSADAAGRTSNKRASAPTQLGVSKPTRGTTKGLQQSIREFESLDVDVGLERILEDNVPEPLIDGPYSEELEARLACDCGRPKSCSCAHFYYP